MSQVRRQQGAQRPILKPRPRGQPARSRLALLPVNSRSPYMRIADCAIPSIMLDPAAAGNEVGGMPGMGPGTAAGAPYC